MAVYASALHKMDALREFQQRMTESGVTGWDDELRTILDTPLAEEESSMGVVVTWPTGKGQWVRVTFNRDGGPLLDALDQRYNKAIVRAMLEQALDDLR